MIRADGGTRTASITGSLVALGLAVQRLAGLSLARSPCALIVTRIRTDMSDLLMLSARPMPLPGSPNIAENQIASHARYGESALAFRDPE